MKKIPTLFERVYENHRVVGITENVTPGCEWVMEGKGVATVKIDGSSTAIINGELYRRFDAKPGRKIPDGAIPCCDPDPTTKHWPHWVKVDTESKADKWYYRAYQNTPEKNDGTYEAIGPHFQSNPYGLSDDILEPHGKKVVEVERSFDGIKAYLQENNIEGLVFWNADGPQCKIKRRDFGLEWPVKHGEGDGQNESN